MKESVNKKSMNVETAIKVERLSKTFIIPHEKSNSLKQAALGIFNKSSYSKFEAINNLSFTVNKGEFFGIIGRNGCGKSTLLKMIAGIYKSDAGIIQIHGKFSPFLELGVGFNPELTARENVYLGGTVLGLSRKEIDIKFNDIIKFAELEEFVDMKFKNFSSGMQVRLAFSLSINAHAEILLMDEVLAVGDTAFQTKCFNTFREFKKEGKTIVLVSHSMDSIKDFCDRVLVIEAGKKVFLGNTEEAVDLYQSINDKKDSLILEIENSANLKDKRWGTRKAEIMKVRFTNSKNVDMVSFSPHEEMNIQINFDTKGSVLKNPNFGIAIKDKGYNLIYNSSSKKNNAIVKDYKGKGTVQFSFKSLPLLKGTYSLSVHFSDSKGEDKSSVEILDHLEDAYKFKMLDDSNNKDNGIILLKTTVKYGSKRSS